MVTKVLLIDSSHYPLWKDDHDELREQIDAADIVIHTFAPHKAQVLKGDAEITDMRQRFPRSGFGVTRFEPMDRVIDLGPDDE